MIVAFLSLPIHFVPLGCICMCVRYRKHITIHENPPSNLFPITIDAIPILRAFHTTMAAAIATKATITWDKR